MNKRRERRQKEAARLDLATPAEREWLDRFERLEFRNGPYFIRHRWGPKTGQISGVYCFIGVGLRIGVMCVTYSWLRNTVLREEARMQAEAQQEAMNMRGAFI